MFVRIVNLFLLIFSVKLCIIQGKNSSVNDLDYWQLRRFLNEQISLIKNNKIEKNSSLIKLLRKFDQSIDGNPDTQEINEFFLGNIKCSRYSIEKKIPKIPEEGNNRFIKLAWTFKNEENATVTVSIPISNRSTYFSKTTIPSEKRGELYYVVNCNIPKDKENLTKEMRFGSDTNSNFKGFTNISGQFRKSHEILAEEKNLKKSTEKKFFVKNSVDNLNIIVLGNISKMDLYIPVDQGTLLEWNENGKISDLVRSLKRMTQTTGLQLNVRNPPSGEWYLELIPGDDSNYRFIIATVFNDSMPEGKNFSPRDVNATNELNEERQEEIFAESRYDAEIVKKPVNYDEVDKIKNESSIKFSSRIVDLGNNEDEARYMKTTDEENEKWMNTSNIFKQPKIHYVTSKDETLKDLTQSTNLDSRIAFPDTKFNNEGTDNLKKIVVGPQIEDRINHESLELEDLTRDASDSFFQRKAVTVDVSSDTNLIIRAGAGRVRIIFNIKNNQMTNTELCYSATSSPIEPIDVYPSLPIVKRYCHVASAGQIVTAAVDMFVPAGISDTVNSVTLTVLVQGLQTNTIQKTANIYIQNSYAKKIDNTGPIMKYYFNNNCGGHLREDKCSKSIWSVDITVQDVDSGLKLVTSSPSGLQARTEYTSGTTNQVTFFYYATCCHQIVDISAVDMYDNYNNRRIDVTEWDNLSEGEIIAIVMGVLFLILLIILIILIIVYCVKTSKSRDLPYTQRYGSGPPAQRPERTSF